MSEVKNICSFCCQDNLVKCNSCFNFNNFYPVISNDELEHINAQLNKEINELKRKLKIAEKCVRADCPYCIHRDRPIDGCFNNCNFEINYEQ